MNNYSCSYMNFLAVRRNYERVTYNCVLVRVCVFVWCIYAVGNRNFACTCDRCCKREDARSRPVEIEFYARMNFTTDVYLSADDAAITIQQHHLSRSSLAINQKDFATYQGNVFHGLKHAGAHTKV